MARAGRAGLTPGGLGCAGPLCGSGQGSAQWPGRAAVGAGCAGRNCHRCHRRPVAGRPGRQPRRSGSGCATAPIGGAGGAEPVGRRWGAVRRERLARTDPRWSALACQRADLAAMGPGRSQWRAWQPVGGTTRPGLGRAARGSHAGGRCRAGGADWLTAQRPGTRRHAAVAGPVGRPEGLPREGATAPTGSGPLCRHRFPGAGCGGSGRGN